MSSLEGHWAAEFWDTGCEYRSPLGFPEDGVCQLGSRKGMGNAPLLAETAMTEEARLRRRQVGREGAWAAWAGLASADTAWSVCRGGGAWAALTKYHPLSSLNSRNSFSHSSRGWKPEVCLWAGLVSPEARSLAACPHVFSWSVLCVHL